MTLSVMSPGNTDKRRASTLAVSLILTSIAMSAPVYGQHRWQAAFSSESSLGGLAAPQIRIIEPDRQEIVPAGERFRLIMRTTPRDFDGHIHVYVDGELRKMIFDNSTRLRVTKGRHVIKVEMVNEHHQGLGATDSVRVTAR